jgi:hypothetical protein
MEALEYQGRVFAQQTPNQYRKKAKSAAQHE